MEHRLISSYLFAKQVVEARGFGDEIRWQEDVTFEDLDETSFLREIAWVILSSGMKESIVRRVFPDVSKCFFDWTSSPLIVLNRKVCLRNALRIFNSRRKMLAIISAAQRISDSGFEEIKNSIARDPFGFLMEFDFVGPITVYHLAKNIGLDVAKPDRHLVRIASIDGYDDVQEFCRQISHLTGDSVAVVDIVLWRFATIEPHYLNLFSESVREGSSPLNW